jgi:photosystem II stability/assembly factor-like uncharacterized protein
MKIYNLFFLLLFQFPFAYNEASEAPVSSPIMDSQITLKILQNLNRNTSGAVNIVFKSTDGGQTWQDISEGLPENLQRDAFFVNESGLYVRAGNGIYHSKSNSTTPFWKKEILPDGHSGIAAGKRGIFAYNYDGQFLQRIDGTGIWSPVYTTPTVEKPGNKSIPVAGE